MSKQLLKIYFPYKNAKDVLLPIEIDILNSENFEKSLKNIKENFPMFVANILGQNPDLEIETDIEKCTFQKMTLEEIDINDI